jgi:uncharacterized protein
MENGFVRQIRTFFQGRNLAPSVILLSSVTLIALWRTVGTQAFYTTHLADTFVIGGDRVATAGLYHIVMCFLLLGVVPAAIVRGVLGERLADYGVRRGDVTQTLVLVALAVPVILAIAFWVASKPEFRAEYPLNRHAAVSGTAFLTHVLSLGLFYVGWEFHFRGFLQHGLRRWMGTDSAVLVQVMASCLAHLGKPDAELLASIPAGLFWGVQAFRTRSLAAGIIQHWLLGASLDFFISFG